MKHSIYICFLFFSLAGCATFQQPPLVTATDSTSCATAKVGQPNHTSICTALDEIITYSSGYQNIYSQSDMGSSALQSSILGTSIASAGFAIFGAGGDTIPGTAFTSGTLSVFNSNLNLEDRALIGEDAVQAFKCFADIGDTFAVSYDRTLPLPSGGSGNLEEYVVDLFPRIGTDIAKAQSFVETNPVGGTPADVQTRQRLLAQINLATEAYEQLDQLRGLFTKVAPMLKQSAAESDDNLRKRLRNKTADVQAMIKEIQALAKSEPKPPAPTDDGTSNSAQTKANARAPAALVAPTPIDQDHIDALRERIRQVSTAMPEFYKAEYDRIPACKIDAST